MRKKFFRPDMPGNDNGFTIIEVMVIMVIITVLTGIVLSSVSYLKDKTYKTRVKSDLIEFGKISLAARGNTGNHLNVIVGGGAAPEDYCLDRNIKNIPTSDTCYVHWVAALQSIQNASGGVTGIKTMSRDPWGSPYLLDWGGPCSPDVIYSVGPNGSSSAYFAADDPSSFDADDIYLYLPLYPGC